MGVRVMDFYIGFTCLLVGTAVCQARLKVPFWKIIRMCLLWNPPISHMPTPDQYILKDKYLVRAYVTRMLFFLLSTCVWSLKLQHGCGQ